MRRRLGIESEDPAILEATTARPPRTSFNRRISGHRRFSFGQLSLDTVKAIKNEAGVTVNDVVVSLCAGALRGWLQERDELPKEPLVAMVPMSVRTEEQMGTFGNRVSMLITPIATDEADPKRRLRRTHELLRGAKTRYRAVPADLLTDATSFIPPAVASLAARTTMEVMGRTRPPVNLVISNVPGPRSPLFLAGAKLEAHYPVSVVVDGVGLNITVMSYLDHLDFGLVADRDQIDDLWTLMERLGRALDELTEAVLGKAAVRRAKRAAPPRTKATAGG
jgi:WS/DGAT/MGAT family acyltransferase